MRSCRAPVQLLSRQARWFHDTRLIAKHFLVWQAAHAQALIERDKTNLALYQWSLVLQKKVRVDYMYMYIYMTVHMYVWS